MGFDKAFLQHQGQWLLQRNLACLQEIFEQVALVSDRIEKLEGIDELSEYSLLADETPEQGPLGGICTALNQCRTPYIFVMACDMLTVNAALIRKMYQQLDDNQVIICSHEGRMETLFAFYHQSCLPVFREQLSENRLQIRREFARLKVKTLILAPDEAGDSFININTPEELADQSDHHMLAVPQMVLIGAFGRNSGKTTLACQLIRERKAPVYAVKVIAIDKANSGCHRGEDGCGICSSLRGSYELYEETGEFPEKDTAQMLAAGAQKAFLLKSLKVSMGDAIRYFMSQVPKGTIVVAESNTLRKFVEPGVFMFAGLKPETEDGMKQSARMVYRQADLFLTPGDGYVTKAISIKKNSSGMIIVRPSFHGSAAIGRESEDGTEIRNHS